jgi:hypothetical protein
MTPPFHVADITPGGDVHALQQYEYPLLEQLGGAADLITFFSTWLWRSPDEFELTLPTSKLSVRFRASSPTSAIATLRINTTRSHAADPPDSQDHLASLSILLTGKDPDADSITLNTLQRHLVHELHDTGHEPAFAMLSLKQRPLVATISLRPPNDPNDRLWFALWDRCLAASYFRKHGLA